MSFWKFWQRRNGKGSFNKDLLSLDLLSHLTYMSAIATAGVSRGVIFAEASRLPYVSSRYFRNVHLLCTQLNYDYAEACRLTGESAGDETAQSLLLRLSSSLSAGEPPADFLTREARVLAESYGDEYERKLESTRKWTDSYAALIVSAALIVVVAVISMMIYPVGLVMLLGLVGLTVVVTVTGSWIIYRAAPKEAKTHSLPQRSREQRLARKLFKILLPLAAIVGVLSMLAGVGLGWTMILVAALAFPVGFLSVRDDKKIDKRDADIAAFLRTLGGVTRATGTTVTEGLSRIDIRATGSLRREVKNLHLSLVSGIEPALCWRRFVEDTGSELIDRTVQIFWDGISKGGDPEEVGARASFFAMKIALLRAKRSLVSTTFGWLSVAMHVAIAGLLVFIVDVMTLFGEALENLRPDAESSSSLQLSSLGPISSFGAEDMPILRFLVTLILLVLTASNAFAVKATGGGHSYKLIYHLCIMAVITGVILVVVPELGDMIFADIGGSGG